MGAEFLGMARIPVKDIIGGETLDQWLDLVDKMGAPVGCIDKSTKKTRQARLHVTITFRPVGTKVGGDTGVQGSMSWLLLVAQGECVVLFKCRMLHLLSSIILQVL